MPERPHAVLQVFEECNPDSPYSFQFIDPTRHQPTYGAQRSNATAVLCQVAATVMANCGMPFTSVAPNMRAVSICAGNSPG